MPPRFYAQLHLHGPSMAVAPRRRGLCHHLLPQQHTPSSFSTGDTRLTGSGDTRCWCRHAQTRTLRLRVHRRLATRHGPET
jgi:hypothetical protein